MVVYGCEKEIHGEFKLEAMNIVKYHNSELVICSMMHGILTCAPTA